MKERVVVAPEVGSMEVIVMRSMGGPRCDDERMHGTVRGRCYILSLHHNMFWRFVI